MGQRMQRGGFKISCLCLWTILWLLAAALTTVSLLFSFNLFLRSHSGHSGWPRHPGRLQDGLPDADVAGVTASARSQAQQQQQHLSACTSGPGCQGPHAHVIEALPARGRKEQLGPQPDLALVIGVISTGEELEAPHRKAARETWLATIRRRDEIFAHFFVPELSPSLGIEAGLFGDIIAASDDLPHMPIGYRFLHRSLRNFNAKFVMRVDVRCYVMPERVLQVLSAACRQPLCDGMDVWAGDLVDQADVPQGMDMEYRLSTGLNTYLPFMADSAYVMTRSLVAALITMQDLVGLKPVTNESISMGLWLIPIDVTRLRLSDVYINSSACVPAAHADDAVSSGLCSGGTPAGAAVVRDISDPSDFLTCAAAVHACSTAPPQGQAIEEPTVNGVQ